MYGAADVVDRGAPSEEGWVVADAIQFGARAHEILGLLSLIALYVLVQPMADQTAINLANVCGPLLFAALLGFGAFVVFRENALAIWTPLFWFRVASAVYFGVGSIFMSIAPDDAVGYVQAFYRLTDTELLKVNLLNAVGALTVLLAARVIGTAIVAVCARSKQQSPLQDVSQPIPIATCAKWFLIVGLAIRYIYVLPGAFGQLDGPLIGSIAQLEKLANVGLFLAFVLAFRGDGRWRLVAWTILGSDLLLSLSTFNKSMVLLQILMPVLAYIYFRRNVRALLIGAAGLLACYIAIKPVADYGRIQLLERWGVHSRGGLTERLNIIVDYLAGGAENEAPGPSLAWLSRLSYANAQGLAVSLYDRGLEGNTVENVAYMFIPRFLWKDKPNMTLAGGQFNYIATGSDGSYSAPGWFAEAYWNGGWLYVVIWMTYAAAILFAISVYSLHYMHRERFVFLPIILAGVAIGYYPDGWFSSALIGGIVILFFTHGALLALSRGWSMIVARQLRAPGI